MTSVLVVDDDRAVAKLVNMILKTEHIEVHEAYNGLEGLDFLETTREEPDLILLDLVMPVMDGREFFRQVRLAGSVMPVVFCSANGAAKANQELGGDGAVSKPFDPDDLIEAVNEALHQSN